METEKKWISYLVVALAAIALAAWFVAWLVRQAYPEAAPQQAVAVPGQPTYAAAGQTSPGFPMELILDPSAQTAEGYAIAYSTSTSQQTAVFYSANSMAVTYDMYLAYFVKNGWTLDNTLDTGTSSRGLYATEGSSTAVGVAIVPQGSGSRVTVSDVAAP